MDATSPLTSDVAFLRGLDFFTEAVTAVEDWGRATPCARWRAVDVLGHVGATVGFGTALLRGQATEWAPEEPPGEAVVGAPERWWQGLAGPAALAVADADMDAVVESPGGPRPVRDGLAFPAIDLFVHAWDIARSAGRDVTIPADVCAFVYALIEPMPADAVRSEHVFAAAVQAPEGATPSQRLLAWTGRDPQWSAGRGGQPRP